MHINIYLILYFEVALICKSMSVSVLGVHTYHTASIVTVPIFHTLPKGHSLPLIPTVGSLYLCLESQGGLFSACYI